MKTLYAILILLTMLMLGACHAEHDDYWALDTIIVDGGDTINIEMVKATAKFTNLNSRQVTSTAKFDGAEVQVKLLRGAYQVSIEGVITYTNATSQTYIRSFRAMSDYVELAGDDENTAIVSLIFLD